MHHPPPPLPAGSHPYYNRNKRLAHLQTAVKKFALKIKLPPLDRRV